MPAAVIVAGPNGAGKTSFANEFPFVRDRLEFVNADEIAREFASLNVPQSVRDFRAGREMLNQINALVNSRKEFMFETTLATLSYARKIPDWQNHGYSVSLIYLRLPSVEHSIERVAHRVMNGGHNIPEHIIRRRFSKSLEYLDKIYKPLVDKWYVYDSREDDFILIDSWKNR